ncbi:DUF7882 family protein [Agrococcus jejuensis]|uniref:DUF7882 domain-containing protein n=1 Tax=Agrococcus jejuensis TaxID=399736 RepID=A0A1G8DP07_9MICO|nr:hypothetical protein [Agrococcus jejuensis]SDH59368.1 hypothetical protein SAMN04489720_1718 [Agrococcus jejuensis]
MGTMHYGNDEAGIQIDDDVLAHVAAVVVAKLRRREPFLLTTVSAGGRESVWIHEASTLRWAYASDVAAPLDKARLERMVRDTNRPTGLTVECLGRPLAAVETLEVAA